MIKDTWKIFRNFIKDFETCGGCKQWEITKNTQGRGVYVAYWKNETKNVGLGAGAGMDMDHGLRLQELVSTRCLLVFSSSFQQKKLLTLKNILLTSLSRATQQRPHTSSLPASLSFPARWPVVAPPCRSFKNAPNSKNFTDLDSFHLPLFESVIEIHQNKAQTCRSIWYHSKIPSKASR